MRNILRLRVLGILLLALGLFGGSAVNVAAQDDSTPPASGFETQSVTVSAFLSDAVFAPVLTGGFTAADDGSTPADVSFSIYVNGDTAATPYATGNTADGAVVFDAVPFGTHTITLDDYELYGQTYSWDFVVGEDAAAFLTFLIPAGETPGLSDVSSLVLSSYAADQVDEPVFYVSDPINVAPPSGGAVELDGIVAEAGIDIPFTGAYVVDRLFYVYLNGDDSSIPYSVQTNGGVGAINSLPSGTHLVVDGQTGVGVGVEVEVGSVTVVTAVFPEGTGDSGDPGDPDTEAPGQGNNDGDDDGDGDGSDDGDDDGDDNGSNGGSANGGDVSKLPSTGQGSSTESSTIVMILGAMSLVALAGGFAWRQRRTA